MNQNRLLDALILLLIDALILLLIAYWLEKIKIQT